LSDRKIWDIAGGTGKVLALRLKCWQIGAKQGKAKLSAVDFQWLFVQVYPDFLSDTN
jgi:hypothetical protein